MPLTAKHAFAKTYDMLSDHLEAIETAMAIYEDAKDSPNWGDVGDLGHLASKLAEVRHEAERLGMSVGE